MSPLNYLLYCSIPLQAPSVGSLGKTTDESSSFVSSEASLSRPNSHKSRVSSARSVPAPSRSQRPDVNGNVAKRFPQSIPADDDDFIGLDVADVIKKLRERLNMSTDLDAIANGEDPDEDENNIQRLYIREDDGKFLYCLLKSRGVRGARYNPYDLICVMSQEAQSATQYFTITASAVTQVYITLHYTIKPQVTQAHDNLSAVLFLIFK